MERKEMTGREEENVEQYEINAHNVHNIYIYIACEFMVSTIAVIYYSLLALTKVFLFPGRILLWLSVYMFT